MAERPLGPTLEDVRDAARALDGIARRTPVLTDQLLDTAAQANVSVKAEFLQRGGAYKFRGIYNKVRLLSSVERSRGIVTVSSGNAGIAAAYAARLCGASCLVVMPATPLEEKVTAIEALGGRTLRHGASSTEMFAKAEELIEKERRTFVHPFDQPEVIAGQATMGLELVDQVADFDVIVAPTGGGGMLAGLAVALRKLKPAVEIVGVQPEGAAGIVLSLKAGTVTELETVDTLADGLAVRRCGELTFALINRFVDDVLVVSDDEILAAVALYWRLLHVAVEPAGAAALAAAIRYPRFRGRRVVVLGSGANVDVNLLRHALSGGTAADWKQARSDG
jgi:threonine dehydratase